jgi:hypothetical protein
MIAEKIITTLLVISFITKVLLDKYISNHNGKSVHISGTNEKHFFSLTWFYIDPVSSETKNIEKICNAFYISFLICCLLLILI